MNGNHLINVGEKETPRTKGARAMKQFALALKAYVGAKGVGAVKALAQDVNSAYNNISGVINGRRGVSIEMAEAIAKHFGHELWDFLLIGKQIDEGEGFNPFINLVKGTDAHSSARADIIFDAAAREAGVKPELLNREKFPSWHEYMAKRINDSQLYIGILETLNSLSR